MESWITDASGPRTEQGALLPHPAGEDDLDDLLHIPGVQRLRTEVAVLRAQLFAAELIASERAEAWAQKLRGSDGSALGPGWIESDEAADPAPEAADETEAPVSRFGAALHTVWERDGSAGSGMDVDDREWFALDGTPAGDADPHGSVAPGPSRRRRWRFWRHRDRHRP